jgi:oxygen-dependent protoporphyrinogen oxidase
MIGIVGAGLTGLALANELAGRGIEHVVLEAENRPGGVIRSGLVDGRVLDFGPQRLRLAGPVEALVRELGLERELVRAPEALPLFVFSRGALREVPTSLRGLAGTDLLSWGGKARLALEPWTAGPRAGERVASFLTRKLGKEAYERLAGPLFGGLYASDPADMSVEISLAGVLRDLGVGRSLLARFARRGGVAPAVAGSFRSGLATLPEALHAARAGSVRLCSPVRRLARSGDGWRLDSDTGVVEAETVVLTCAADSAGRLLSEVAPAAAARLRSLVYNPLAVVHLAGDTGLRGLGYQVAFGEGLATRGVTWNGSLFGESRRGLHTAFLGGAMSAAILEEPDDRLGGISTEEFLRVTGRHARVLSVSRTRMPAWDVSWRVLRDLELPRGILAAGSWRSRPGISGRLAEARRLAVELDAAESAPSP